MERTELAENYKKACEAYVEVFCKKQDMYFDEWVGDEVGGIALCNDFYFGIGDIIDDIEYDQPVGSIIDWYYDNLKYEDIHINYKSYIRGLRVQYLYDKKIIEMYENVDEDICLTIH